MSSEITSLAFMVLGFLGMSAITVRKIEDISKLPNTPSFIQRLQFKERVKKETRDIVKKKYFGIQVFTQKLLSRIRILILKLDNKIFNLNLKLKEHSKKTKEDIDLGLTDIKDKLKKSK
ncbi:hypothetical protein GYA01_01155 [Patescibacteria group bacterium]|nr:hypothetical protein [Patescibacteria group bacterium]